MQLDTDEGDTFVPPAGVVAAPVADQTLGHESTTNQDTERSEVSNQGTAGLQD